MVPQTTCSDLDDDGDGVNKCNDNCLGPETGMTQNSKHMTSADFDAWMKAKGIRLASGKPALSAAPESDAATSPVETGK